MPQMKQLLLFGVEAVLNKQTSLVICSVLCSGSYGGTGHFGPGNKVNC